MLQPGTAVAIAAKTAAAAAATAPAPQGGVHKPPLQQQLPMLVWLMHEVELTVGFGGRSRLFCCCIGS